MKKNAVIFLLALCMALLCGCRAAFDPAAAVQGELDLICRGQYTDAFLAATGLTAEAAARRYADGIEAETESFAELFGADLTRCGETAREELRAFYRTAYSHARYEVGAAEETDTGYRVTVTVWPAEILRQFRAQEAGALLADWEKRYNKGEFDTMPAEEYENTWIRSILDALSPRLENMAYGEPETVTVDVTRGETRGQYTIAPEAFARIDALLLAY